VVKPTKQAAPPPKGDDDGLVTVDLEKEKSRQLDLLSQMFGADADDWGGKESIDGEDDDAYTGVRVQEDNGEDAMSVEEAEVEATLPQSPQQSPFPDRSVSPPPPTSPIPTRQPSKQKALKDMFQPQEESSSSFPFTLHPPISN